jgi:putative tricarboxylic transport membrane protein
MAATPGSPSDAALSAPSETASPPVKTWRERLLAASAYLIILAAAVFFYAMADRIRFDKEPGRIGPDLWPKIILVLTIIACLWRCMVAFIFDVGASAASAAVEHPAEQGEIDEPEVYPLRVWAAIAGTLVYIWVLSIAGFFVSTFVFLFFIIFVAGYRRPLAVLLLAAAGSLFFMTIFVRVVYVSLPLGIPPFNAISIALLKLLGP